MQRWRPVATGLRPPWRPPNEADSGHPLIIGATWRAAGGRPTRQPILARSASWTSTCSLPPCSPSVYAHAPRSFLSGAIQTLKRPSVPVAYFSVRTTRSTTRPATISTGAVPMTTPSATGDFRTSTR